MSVQDNAKIARSVYDKYNTHDIDGMVALAAEDIDLLNIPLDVTMHGPEGFRQYIQGWATAFPDSQIAVINVLAGEAGAVVEFRGRGTHTGPLVSPAGEIPATGRAVDLSFCDVLQIKGGKITSLHTYYDAATLMGQLGLKG